MSEPLAPFRLKPFFSPRPWGRTSLSPWYSSAQVGDAQPVGEAWLTGPASILETGPLAGHTLASVTQTHATELLGPQAAAVAAPEFPLLVKLLFPADKLSVQVHPDDAHAQAIGQPRGKTECWYVLSSDPRAQLALGFKPSLTSEQLTPDAIRTAIAAGTLEDLLNWVSVAPSDMFFVDAGTVHAIGPGMVLLETQQTSDTTFRMYDYGRPRELHVEEALCVMKTSTAAGKVASQKMRPTDGSEFTRLIQQQYFTVDRYDLAPKGVALLECAGPACLVGLEGSARLERADGEAVELPRGQAVIVPVSAGPVHVRSEGGTSFAACLAPPPANVDRR